MITPYLVKPVSANQIALPTDGYRAATDVQRLLTGQSYSGKSNEGRPKPSMGNPQTVPASPSIGRNEDAAEPAKVLGKASKKSKKSDVAAAAPGFGN